MSAVLRIYGQQMDCDEVVRHCPIQPCSVARRDEPKFPLRTNSDAWTRSNVNLCMSEADFDDFPGQCRETVEFLTEHLRELRTLFGLPGIDEAGIAFGLRKTEAYADTDTLPAELVRLAGQLKLGIALSHYPIADEDRGELDPLSMMS